MIGFKRTNQTVLLSLPLLALFIVSAHANSKAKITNNTPFTAKGTVKYAACKNDNYTVKAGKKWQAKRKGACLVKGITATLSGQPNHPGPQIKKVSSYKSGGTTRNDFFIQPAGDNYKVYSAQEYKRKVTNKDMSPGFMIENKTKWPLAIALSQIGCLYHGVVQPGKTFRRKTGAVWFTIQASVQPDGKDPRKTWDCIAPVAKIIGVGVLAAATGGAGAFMAAPTVAAGSAAAALSGIATSTAVTVGATAAGAGVAATVGSLAKAVGKVIAKNGTGTKKGQYAGFARPFRCKKMPTYEITGGPAEPQLLPNGGYLLEAGTPLKITKTNTCGNGMMRKKQ
ncbi:MAG: hypothetical protein GKS01_05130 [Alphaproteobacteria bacterium]|nr:hypothetical protein [Alphaproteobacteria bacterium]